MLLSFFFYHRGDHVQLFCGSNAKNEQQFPPRWCHGHAFCQHEIVNPSKFSYFLPLVSIFWIGQSVMKVFAIFVTETAV